MPFPRRLTTGPFNPDLLFRPARVGVIGTETLSGAELLRNLHGGGFAGSVHTANTADEIRAFEVAPDLAFLCEEASVLGDLAALGERGTRAAVVVADGDPACIAAAARAARVRVYGPNSTGIAIPAIGLQAIRSHVLPRHGRAALISQSTALCRAVLDWAEPNGVGFSHVIGVGDGADLGFAVALDWLSRDPETGVILLDLRNLRSPRRFLSAARAASRLRPVVAIRPGGRLLDAGGEAEAVWHAALRRAGVLAVNTFDDLLAAAETLTRTRPPRNETLAIVASEAGPAHLAADAVLREGLRLTELAPETNIVLNLAGIRPMGSSDYVLAVPAYRLSEVAALLAGAREVGGVMIVHVPRGDGDDVAISAIIAASRAVRVPLVVCAMGETTGRAHRRALAEAGVSVFATPEQTVRGFLHLVQNRRSRQAARELPPSHVLRFTPNHSAVIDVFSRANAEQRAVLRQDEALAILAAYDIPVATARVALDTDEAVNAADAIGFPVALKLRRQTRPDAVGPVALALDLRNAADLRRAADMLDARRQPGSLPGFLVQRLVLRARELRIVVRQDPLFGPSIGVGPGGTAAALDGFRDMTIDLPPLNLPLAHALIARTRAAASLGAMRDAPAADIAAVAETLVRISQMVIDYPQLAELDLNPLFADAEGVVAADAFIRLRGADEPEIALALPPYPAHLTSHVTSGDESFTLRPIRFEDAEAHAAMFSRLTPEDIRFRFFSSVRALTPEQLARMTEIDYDREMAFIAIRDATGETAAVGRLIREGESGIGEFAVVVQPDAKGRGLASALMGRLIDWGRGAGLSEIVGQVLAENAPMLAFTRHLGFSIGRSADDPTVMEARLRLAD